MDNKTMIEIASIRLALIQPAFNNTYPDYSKKEYYDRICANPIKMPDGKEIRYARGTLACWESAYRKGGFEALLPKQRCDLGHCRKLDTDTMTAIARLHQEFPKINATQIYHKLIADGVINKKDVSLSTIQRYIKKTHLHPSSRTLKDRKAFEEEFCTGMYQADTLHGPYLVENGIRRKTYCIMLLDDKSRLIVGGEFFYADNAYNFQKVFKNAVASRGIPSKLYVDNGSTYKNEQLSLICGQLGTILIHAPVRDGASKGKVERNFRTLRNRFLNLLDPSKISGLEELNQKLREYINQHNTTVHSATGIPPLNRYLEDLSHVKMPPSQDWLDSCFMNRVQRTVKNDGAL